MKQKNIFFWYKYLLSIIKSEYLRNLNDKLVMCSITWSDIYNPNENMLVFSLKPKVFQWYTDRFKARLG